MAALRKGKPKDSSQKRRYSFDDALHVVTEVAHKFGTTQNEECVNIKNELRPKDPSGSGLVPLRSFYYDAKGNLDYHFAENQEYLRSMGVLDVTVPQRGPQVLVANYIAGPSNCVLSSSHYKVCCIPECEAILEYFESQIQGPVASPAQVLSAAATMPIRTTPSGVSFDA